MLETFDEIDETDARPTRSRGSRVRRALAATLALLLVLLVGIVAAYLLFLNHTLSSNVKHSALLPTPGVSGAAAPPARKAAAKDAQNILFIGSDSRAAVADGRSDVIVLMHVAADRKTVTLVHFPRDLYVSVPGHGKDKINASFAYGGAPLLVQTLQNLVGVPIDHVALVGFEGFKSMTDAVGGVNVYVEEAGSSNPKYTFNKGFQLMNGDTALAFVRERHALSEGDISRGKRQEAFIKALLLKSLSRDVLTNPVRLAQFVDAGTKYLTVDQAFSIADLRSEAFTLRNLRGSDIAFVTAPFTGFGTAPNGGSIDIVDEPGMRLLGDALQNDAMSGYKDQTHTP